MNIPHAVHESFLFNEATLNVLHVHAGAWLDQIMIAITHTGSELFYFTALPLLYWIGWRSEAIKIGLVFMVSSGINDAAKHFFASPRPDPALLDPAFSNLTRELLPKSYGFPSGHTQGSVSFWWAATRYLGNRPFFDSKKFTALALFFIIMVPYSRLYLGVHHLGDVVGGYLLVLLFVPLVFGEISLLEENFSLANSAVVTAMTMFIPLLIFFILPEKGMARITGTASGLLLGAWWDHRISPSPVKLRLPRQLIVIFFGFLGLVLIRWLLKEIVPGGSSWQYLRYAFIGCWITLGAPSMIRVMKRI